MRNKGVYRYDLNLRRGNRLRITRATPWRIEHADGSVTFVEREMTFVWDHGGFAEVSLLPEEISPPYHRYASTV